MTKIKTIHQMTDRELLIYLADRIEHVISDLDQRLMIELAQRLDRKTPEEG